MLQLTFRPGLTLTGFRTTRPCINFAVSNLKCISIFLWINFSQLVLQEILLIIECVVPENIHTSPMEGIFSKTPNPLQSPIKIETFLSIFWSYRTPHPPGNSNPFYGGSNNIFSMCTIKENVHDTISGTLHFWFLDLYAVKCIFSPLASDCQKEGFAVNSIRRTTKNTRSS